MTGAYELVIFDCDGTLVDSEPLTNALIADMINELGVSINTEECLDLFAGKTLSHIVAYIQEQKVSINDAEFEKDYRSRCLALFNNELKSIAGVEQLLKKLDIPSCIASNGPHEKMDVTLPASGLDKYFEKDRIFSAYDVNEWKPSPSLFLYAAEQLNVDPSKCIVVEDTWSGVMGAVNANIDVLAYNPHGDTRLYIDGVPNFSDMKDIEQHLLGDISKGI